MAAAVGNVVVAEDGIGVGAGVEAVEDVDDVVSIGDGAAAPVSRLWPAMSSNRYSGLTSASLSTPVKDSLDTQQAAPLLSYRELACLPTCLPACLVFLFQCSCSSPSDTTALLCEFNQLNYHCVLLMRSLERRRERKRGEGQVARASLSSQLLHGQTRAITYVAQDSCYTRT